jgi:hypothetical protein
VDGAAITRAASLLLIGS